MKTKDQIKFLNSLIAQLKASRSTAMLGRLDAEADARRMQGYIMEELKKYQCEDDIIEAINCIDFSGMNYQEPYNGSMSSMSGRRGCSSQGEQAYYHSMQNMIDILVGYRDVLKEKIEKPMKLWTLIFSAIAAVGAILSFIF